MPLNIKENNKPLIADVSITASGNQKPVPKHSFYRSVTLAVFILVVMLSLLFIVYLFSFGKIQKQQLEKAFNPVSPESVNSSQSLKADSKRIIADTTIVNQSDECYTVYIASYLTRLPAEKEVSHWRDAGFLADVVEANNYYRVAVGRFKEVDDANRFTQQYEESFEHGYSVERIPDIGIEQ